MVAHAGGLAAFSAFASRPGAFAGRHDRPSDQIVVPSDFALLPPPPAPPLQRPDPMVKPAQKPPDPPKPEPLPEPAPDELRPGIDKSDAQTPAWQGFAKATPHAAPKFEVEQSALTPQPGLPAKAPSVSTPAPGDAAPPNVVTLPVAQGVNQAQPAQDQPEAPPPTLVPPQQPEASKPSGPAPTALPEQPVAEAPKVPESAPDPESATPPGPKQPEIKAEPMGDEAPKPPPSKASEPVPARATPGTPGLDQGKHAEEAPDPRPIRPPGPPDAPQEFPPPGLIVPRSLAAPQAASGSPHPGDQPGERADTESMPTSTVEVVEKTLGRTLAAQGLQISTVRPRWTITTTLTANPRDVVARVWFRTNGTVAKVELLQDSGDARVDEPLVSSLYQWRAKGEELQRRGASGKPIPPMAFRIRLE